MLFLVELRHAKLHAEVFTGAIVAARKNLPGNAMRLMVRPQRDTLLFCVDAPGTGECPAVRPRRDWWHRSNCF